VAAVRAADPVPGVGARGAGVAECGRGGLSKATPSSVSSSHSETTARPRRYAGGTAVAEERG